jgi:glycosyltransferase involved in cell wall biosynthesis
MRILFVSNSLPPYARGGYEQWCEEVAAALAERGHVLAVLTTRPPTGNATTDDAGRPFQVFRLLHPQVEGGLGETIVRLVREQKRQEASNLAVVRRVLQEFRPEVALVWGMWNIDRSVPQLLETCLGSSLAYYLCDYWPSLPNAYIQRLEEPARHVQMQYVKSAVARFYLPRLMQADDKHLRLEHPICVSRAVRDILVTRGVDVGHAQVIYGGTEIDEFSASVPVEQRGEEAGAALRLLYIGRLERVKGVHTLVRAMIEVGDGVALDIVGGGEPDYITELQGLIVQGAIADRVRLLGPVPRGQIPELLRRYGGLVFPSEWEEPFARSVLEAMAAGLPVIGTTTGGTGEVLIEGVTGLTYAAGDAQNLAGQIRRLAGDPQLRRQLAATASRTIRQYYTIGRMVDELEAALAALAPKPVLTSC